ncbi:ABC transporter permease [Deinococcus peraridilitoris]|uniref:ABC-type dipeptide/oligopeptide/nickel transport system, permease component n=1 Tax=Deinococcus peraridilitoris (strain DSM 19664 / LMG 22246 / CIP 109416 / KR-200) TaxID=937777 RepID=L0A7H2_DEIPD|nr:ABC transporter permease [Deinococcus peraridilitoris]AFZ69404.1 ABC-type dipeptide/oligopeptide/nickel transport system, permease component [Deinococcus peraridilitoris DSM 19664]
MIGFLLRRLGGALMVILAISVLTFSMLHLVPGDPVAIMLGEQATAERISVLRQQLGLDRPLYVQYGTFLLNALQGDFGTSIRSGQPVLQEVTRQLPATLILALSAVAIAAPLGILLGTVAAVTRSRFLEFLTTTVPLIGLSMPTFWSGLLMILLFSLYLEWLPVVGNAGLASLIMPAIALALPASAVIARMTRSTLAEVLGQDYVRTARAKGLLERVVTYKHALRNALIPTVTIIGLQFGGLIGGAVIVESVFARPGLGRLAVNAILTRDFPMVQAVVLFGAVGYVLVNLLVDLLYSVLDPRIRQ